MPKTLTLSVPTGAKIIVSNPRKATDTGQTDLFGSYKDRWMTDMANFILTLPRPIAMSTVRVEAAKRGMSAPLSKNWYGATMKKAGLKKTGYQTSPLKSRRHGVEAVWE
jgi:hypothetical protein